MCHFSMEKPRVFLSPSVFPSTQLILSSYVKYYGTGTLIQETHQAKDPTKSLRSSFWLMDAMMESAYALSLSDLAPPAAAPPPTPPPPTLTPETPLVDSIFAKKKSLSFPPSKKTKTVILVLLLYGFFKEKVFFRPLRNLNLTQTSETQW